MYTSSALFQPFFLEIRGRSCSAQPLRSGPGAQRPFRARVQTALGGDVACRDTFFDGVKHADTEQCLSLPRQGVLESGESPLSDALCKQPHMADDSRAIWKDAECWRSRLSVRPKDLSPEAPPCRPFGCHRPASRKGAWQWPPLPSTPCRFERTGVAGQWTVTLEKATHQPLARLERPCCAGPSQRSPDLSRGRPRSLAQLGEDVYQGGAFTKKSW